MERKDGIGKRVVVSLIHPVWIERAGGSHLALAKALKGEIHVKSSSSAMVLFVEQYVTEDNETRSMMSDNPIVCVGEDNIGAMQFIDGIEGLI